MSQMAAARSFHGRAALGQHPGCKWHPILTRRDLTPRAVPETMESSNL